MPCSNEHEIRITIIVKVGDGVHHVAAGLKLGDGSTGVVVFLIAPVNGRREIPFAASGKVIEQNHVLIPITVEIRHSDAKYAKRLQFFLALIRKAVGTAPKDLGRHAFAGIKVAEHKVEETEKPKHKAHKAEAKSEDKTEKSKHKGEKAEKAKSKPKPKADKDTEKKHKK